LEVGQAVRRRRRKERGKKERKWQPTGMGMRLLRLPIPIPPKKEVVKRERQKSQLHLRQTVRLNKRLTNRKISKQEVCELKSLFCRHIATR
jgi:hypothetical protein